MNKSSRPIRRHVLLAAAVLGAAFAFSLAAAHRAANSMMRMEKRIAGSTRLVDVVERFEHHGAKNPLGEDGLSGISSLISEDPEQSARLRDAESARAAGDVARMRRLLAEIEDVERENLATRATRAADKARELKSTLALVGFAALIALALALWRLLSDIEARARAEIAVCEVNARLTGVLDGAKWTSIVAADTTGKITMFNAGAARLLGYGENEMVGRHDVVFLHDPEEISARAEEASKGSGSPLSGFPVVVELARRSGFGSREWTYRRKDGTAVRVDLVTTYLVDDAGAARGFLCVAQDASARLEAENLRERVAHQVVHELNVPLGAITLGLSSLGAELFGSLSDQQKKVLSHVADAASMLKRLVADLLDSVRAESGKLDILPEKLDAAELARLILGSFLPKAGEHGISLTLDAPGSAVVWADPVRVRQIAGNLIDNALKFTPRGGAVVLRVEGPRDGMVRLSVQDDGPGMPDADAARVFERLYQTTAKVRAGRPGLGLGLFIAKELVERQGGRIELETKPGQGCLFSFTLPAMPDQEVDPK